MTCLHIIRTWILSIALGLLLPSIAFANQDWEQFKRVFIDNGRVIDTGQNNMSHSEGQGMAMLLAVHNNDPLTFSQLWNWTQHNLQVREDRLIAWSWMPSIGVNDLNNASDGDLLIAWALSKAYKKWSEPAYLYEALRISQAIRQLLLRKTSKGLIILPGISGFEKPEGLKLNLSYWVFPAIEELGNLDPAPEWLELRLAGLKLLEEAQFGKWRLPPDWLMLGDSKLSPTDEARFGYDAVRIPLYLCWDNQAGASRLKPFQSFWGSFKGQDFLPAWIDLLNGAIGSYNASTGFHSVASLTLSYPQIDSIQLPPFDPTQGYYSAMLYFFTTIALEELKK